MRETYKNYWDFLKKTPKNLWSIVVLWATSLLFIGVACTETFDNLITQVLTIASFVGIMGAALYRPYTIYKKFKNK